MSKPYSILAAALVASGRSSSTATVIPPAQFQRDSPGGESDPWFLYSNRRGSLDSESPLAMDQFGESAPENVAALAA